jgi:hypothetical protein
MKLMTPLDLVLRIRDCGTIPHFPPAIFMAWCLTGNHQEMIKDLARNERQRM